MCEYRIVYPKNYRPAEKNAALQLSEYLGMILGGKPETAADGTRETQYEICVGDTNRTRSEKPDNREGYKIWNDGEKLFILGGSDRGTLYGVYAYLEFLGCRFYAADTEIIPEAGLLIFPEEPLCSSPAFEYRDLFWSCTFGTELSAKLRLNGCVGSRDLPAEWGGGIGYAGPHFVHTLPLMLTEEEYFTGYPEYFSEIDGKRTGKRLYSQLCLTNEDVFRIILAKVREWLNGNPDAKIVSVSQDDAYDLNSYCTCPECRKVNEQEKTPGGTLFRFVNRIAEAIEDEYPGIAVDTLAYQHSVTPPAVTVPRKNVIIRYCTGSCGLHPIGACEENEKHRFNLERWHGICSRIYIWDYTTNFAQYLAPFPNFASLAENMRFFRANGVLGVFEQGMYQKGKSGEFAELRSYVLAKLLWDPEQDIHVLMKEFSDVYYGAAADKVLEFLGFIYNKMLSSGSHLPVAFRYDEKFKDLFGESDINRCDGIWEDALSAVSGREKEHVLRSMLCWRFVKCNLGFFGNAEYERWKADCSAMGVVQYNEGALFEQL